MNFSLINSESWFESDTVNLIYLIGSITLRWWWSVLLSTKQINMYLRKLSFAEFQSYLLNLLIEIHLNLVWQVHGQMWVFDCKEHWEPKNFCFWTVVLEKTLESPLDCKEIQPVHPKGHQPWIFTGRTDAKTETPILWPPDWKNRLTGKDSDAGKDWGQEEKGTTEDEMVGWHLNGHEMDVSLSKLREIVKNREAWHAVVHGATKSQTQLSNWSRRTIRGKGERKSSWQYSNVSARRSICFQGERETPHSVQTFRPFVKHRHENFPEEAGLDAMREHGRPHIPWILVRMRNIMV